MSVTLEVTGAQTIGGLLAVTESPPLFEVVASSAVSGVPGPPVIALVDWGNPETFVSFSPPADDGGSPIFDKEEGGYRIYANGVQVEITFWTNGEFLIAGISQDLRGQTFRVAAVNAVGIGALSAPVTLAP